MQLELTSLIRAVPTAHVDEAVAFYAARPAGATLVMTTLLRLRDKGDGAGRHLIVACDLPTLTPRPTCASLPLWTGPAHWRDRREAGVCA